MRGTTRVVGRGVLAERKRRRDLYGMSRSAASRWRAVRQALIEGENSGAPRPFDVVEFERGMSVRMAEVCAILRRIRRHSQILEHPMQTISATDLARNTREVLDRVVTRGETVAVERNHALIAQIVPAQPTMTAAQALAGLPRPILTAAQAAAWLKDSRQGFDEAVRSPWE